MKFVGVFSLLLLFSLSSYAEAPLPKGRIESPFEACKNVIIVEKGEYQSHQKKWDDYSKECALPVQSGVEAGFWALNPLKTGSEYLNFSQRVARKVLENLKKSRAYADCSSACFAGAEFCPADSNADQKRVNCEERKKEVLAGMKVKARKIRMELALSNENHSFVKINMHNVLSSGSSSFINKNLSRFELLPPYTPTPVSKVPLESYEIKEAQRRWSRERKAIEDQVKAMNTKIPAEITARKLMENFDHHKSRYRSLIYEEAPIFSVIEDAQKFEGTDPVWEDAQIARAFQKLSHNAKITEEKVHASISKGKLEFSRSNGEAIENWLKGFTKDGPEADLLYYIGMKSQVEEVLKEDPSSCAVATAMMNRLHSKDQQNVTFTVLATLGSGGALKAAEMGTSGTLRIASAVSGRVASGLVGIGMGSGYLGNSFADYQNTKTETATASGLNEKSEGITLRKDKDVERARDSLQTTAALLPVDIAAGVGAAKLFRKNTRKVSGEVSGKVQAVVQEKQNTRSLNNLPVMGDEVSIELKSGAESQKVTGTVVKRDGRVLTVQGQYGKETEVYIQEADKVVVRPHPKYPNGMTFEQFAKEAGYEQRSTTLIPEPGEKVLIEYTVGQGPHQVYGTVTQTRGRILTIKDAKGNESELYLQEKGKLFVEKDKGAYIPENPIHPALQVTPVK